jgi:hypothetical protein
MPLVLALMALLALGPFLHAHYGSSRLTGFHVDGMGALPAHAHAQTDTAAYFSPDSEEESAAVGISASHTRQSLTDDSTEEDVSPVWLLVAAVVCACVLAPTRVRGATPIFIRPHRACRAGFPPLAHAPPTSHC